ncbi:hypothetical protein [Streptomyces sp. NPDC057199]|uniref:hypothetical protein n=1 Tax=Streptomyces sp. NPDC057199 TaxID=3346047 RepID=UPI003640DAA4
MTPDGLDDLENQAERRRRGAAPPRNPKPTRETGQQKAERLERERQQREESRRQEEERREEEDRQAEAEKAAREAEAAAREPKASGDGKGSGSRPKVARPKSMPFYPNPEHETFLWSIREAAASRQQAVPATAVLRLALTRLEEQMTPSEIVKALGSAVQPEGKMGRPRL